MPQYNTHDPHFNSLALGVLIQVKNAKNLDDLRNRETCCVRTFVLLDHTESVFDFQAEITGDGQEIMRNEFRLANVESKLLLG